MLNEKSIRAVLDRVLARSRADETEVVYVGEDTALTRFANSYIHQNVAQRQTHLQVRVVLGKRIGVASTNDLSSAGLDRVLKAAVTIAEVQQENPDFKGLPAGGPIPPVNAFVAATATCSPVERAKAVGIVCRKAKSVNVVASGAYTTGVYDYAVANSHGARACFAHTLADFTTVIMSDSGSGYADFASLDAREVNAEALADEAIGKALRSRCPSTLEPGEYPVILEEYAVSDFLEFMAMLGFSAQAVQEGRSFMKLGEKVVGENISIWDDGSDLAGLPLPFDFEGVPRQRVDLITNGIARAVVYDSYTAGKEGKVSTGHALPAPNRFGPIPLNLFMNHGDRSKEEMLKGIERGIWVSRFWYTRVMDPLRVIVTGMTRDGTFLIENGEITRPVKNLRFTQSYLEALSAVEAISRTTKLQRGFRGSVRVPALRIGKFRFTGQTQ